MRPPRTVSPEEYGPPAALREARDAHAAPNNDFMYYASDRSGMACPLGAHVRRVNPRDALADPERGVSAQDALAKVNQHRILRRGRSILGVYRDGKELRTRRGESVRGVFFICLNANLERQFEFVQQAWLGTPGFAGLKGESGPLLGREPGRFTIPGATGAERPELAKYVSVRGGGYFFLPGLRALRYLLHDTDGAPRS